MKELTYYMGDKEEAELWAIVREACRVSTPAWRAWEQLHSYHSTVFLIEGEHFTVYDDGSKRKTV
jgi:hypothetical protein